MKNLTYGGIMRPIDTIKPLCPGILKVLLYSVFTALIVLIFTAEAHYNFSVDLYSERSWTEMCQITLLFFSALVLVITGIKDPESSSLTTLLAGMIFIAMIRECDAILDSYFFDGAWQTGAMLVASIVCVLVCRKKDSLMPSIVAFMKRPSFGFFVCSFITVFVFSRLFGRNVLWHDIMGDAQFIRAVKNAAEEGSELFGYGMMFLACIELYIESVKGKIGRS